MQDLSTSPAFPVPSDATHTGVTVRDWFAAIALQGIAAKGLEVFGDRVITEDEKNQIMATRAYKLADAMVTAKANTAAKQEPAKAKSSSNPRSRRSSRPNRPTGAPQKSEMPRSSESSSA